jgi:hypothetical protein
VHFVKHAPESWEEKPLPAFSDRNVSRAGMSQPILFDDHLKVSFVNAEWESVAFKNCFSQRGSILWAKKYCAYAVFLYYIFTTPN